MADTENHVSMLPQLARSGSVLRALQDVTPSGENARYALPAPTAGHKRQGSNLLEPVSKRKTLAERAGEPIKQFLAVPRPNTAMGDNIIPKSNLQAYRSASNSSASSYRSTSASSRTTSYSESINTGIRQPSQTISGFGRPKTALAKDRTTRTIETRPVTSLGQHGLSHEIMTTKSMGPPSLSHLPQARDSSSIARASGKCLSHNTNRRYGIEARPTPKRDSSLTSLNSRLTHLSLAPNTPRRRQTAPASPSRLPRPATPALPCSAASSASKRSPTKTPNKAFLTRFSNIEAIDVDEHYKDFKRMFEDAQCLYKETLGKVTEAKDESNIYKSAINKLEDERLGQTATIISLTDETGTLKYRLESAEKMLVEQQIKHEAQLKELTAQHKHDLETLRRDHRDDIEHLKVDNRKDMVDMKHKHKEDLEHERSQRIAALNQASTQGVLEQQKQRMQLETKEQEIRTAKAEAERLASDLQREKTISDDLRRNLSEAGTNASHMETGRLALQKKIEYLESDNKTQSEAYAQMERRMNEALEGADRAVEKLRKEETLRRKLHNQVQELKGNIRVFCRVRPTPATEQPEELAKMSFPDTEDAKEIEVKGQEETSSLGKITTKTYPFSFDRVFDSTSNNSEIFDEISQLIQSALDGFNVCIFAYGQTGSGKTYTMSSDDGMIPRALRQIYNTSKELEERGWVYSMEGSFIEVYNEDLRDLLGKEGENKKHEIRHDMVKCETTITDVTTVNLDSQDQVEEILERAMAKRSVAATKANERSSRSHSVFILKLVGENSITGERSKGTLNLVDLAGSERLSQSKVEGQRLKETQSINKSLSCLGDVIGALGQQGAAPFDPKSSVNGSGQPVGSHIPYRNSKLTYLLQFSLGGNSKTLMFVMVAPEKRCLGETITSLKFAEKVSKTRVGVAKKVSARS